MYIPTFPCRNVVILDPYIHAGKEQNFRRISEMVVVGRDGDEHWQPVYLFAFV